MMKKDSWLTQHASPHWIASKIYIEGIPDKDREKVIEDLCLAYPTWFYELLTEFEGGPLVLEPFQIRYLLDPAAFKITNKTRQAGGSVQLALAKFYKAYTTPSYRCDIVSVNLKEATDKITKVRNLWESLPDRFRIPLSIDNALSIGFHSGGRRSVINSLAASAGIRGARKDVVFDEFAHIRNAEELFMSALPATMNGDLGIDIVSTPLGRHNYYGKIWLNEPRPDGKKPFDQFSRHKFIWCDVERFVVNGPEARRVWKEELNEDMDRMDELIDAFGNEKIKSFRMMYPRDYFLQEFCGHFIDDSSAFFTFELIESCLKYPSVKDMGGVDGYDSDTLDPWDDLVGRPDDTTESQVIMGLDFGASGEEQDKTSIQILEKSPDGRLKHRYSRNLSKKQFKDYPAQADEIARVALAFRVSKIIADNGHAGIAMIPLIRRIAPNLQIEPVAFSNTLKEEMVMNLRVLMEQGKIWLMGEDRELQAQLHGMRADVLPSGLVRYHGEPHDDMFWALALAAREGTYKHFAMYTVDDLWKGI